MVNNDVLWRVVHSNRSTQFQMKIILLAYWPGLICHLPHWKNKRSHWRRIYVMGLIWIYGPMNDWAKTEEMLESTQGKIIKQRKEKVWSSSLEPMSHTKICIIQTVLAAVLHSIWLTVSATFFRLIVAGTSAYF